MAPIPQDLVQNILGYVQVSSLLAKKALDQVATHRQTQKRAAEHIPGLVDHLLAIKTIKDTEKEAATRLLGDHAETLALLKVAHDEIASLRSKLAAATRGASPESGSADKVADDVAGSGGHGVAPGDYDSLRDPVVGRRTSLKKASDVALARGLNL